MFLPGGKNTSKTYDIPNRAKPVNYDLPKNHCPTKTFSVLPLREDKLTLALDNLYDLPRSLSSDLGQNEKTPTTLNSSLLSYYDVPRRKQLPKRLLTPSGISLSSTQSSLDGNIFHSGLLTASVTIKDPNFEDSLALNTLERLQAEAVLAISRLLFYVVPKWRTRQMIEPVFFEIKLALMRMRSALHNLTDFSEEILGNAIRSGDYNLEQSLGPLVKTLRYVNILVQNLYPTEDVHSKWTLENLVVDDTVNKRPDNLDEIVACAQFLVNTVSLTMSPIREKAISSFISDDLWVCKMENSHTTDCFKNSIKSYASLRPALKELAAKNVSTPKDVVILKGQQESFKNLTMGAETTKMSLSNTDSEFRQNQLTENEKFFLIYGTLQLTRCMENLQRAIDIFLDAVEKNQPPKFFIAYGKLVIVSAHNLIIFGDMIYQHFSERKPKQILRCTEVLSEALHMYVTKSRIAVENFPCIAGVQEMVDSVIYISHMAFGLKAAMLQAVKIVF